MARYVDAYVVPIPKRNLKSYLRMAKIGAATWKDHGAIGYAECVADDLDIPWGKGFRKMAGLKKGETLVFAFVVFRSRGHRDRVNAAVMKDPRMNAPAMPKKMPFDMKRFAVGGFRELVGW